MRPLIRRFDAFLCRVQGVFAFCNDEGCILRIQITQAPHILHFPNLMVHRGEPVLLLHLWNERIPPLPSSGPDLAWATRLRRLFVQSLHAVARQMSHDPRLFGLRAVGGITVLLSHGDGSGGTQLMGQLGFKIMPYQNKLGRFGEFWENFYSWWLMWTYNPISLRRRKLTHLRRSEIWMPAGEFLRRYGGSSPRKIYAPAE